MKLQPPYIVDINKLNIEDSRIPKSINDSLYDTDALNRTSWEENSGFQHISNRKAVLTSQEYNHHSIMNIDELQTSTQLSNVLCSISYCEIMP